MNVAQKRQLDDFCHLATLSKGIWYVLDDSWDDDICSLGVGVHVELSVIEGIVHNRLWSMVPKLEWRLERQVLQTKQLIEDFSCCWVDVGGQSSRSLCHSRSGDTLLRCDDAANVHGARGVSMHVVGEVRLANCCLGHGSLWLSELVSVVSCWQSTHFKIDY